MKKSILYLFIIGLLILSLIIPFISADPINIDTKNPENTNIAGLNSADIPESQEELQQESINYLKQEWTEVLEKYPIGKFFLKIGKIFEYFNPLWKIILGIEYSFSWAFLFSLVIWVTIVWFFYMPLSAIIENKVLALISALLVGFIIGITKVIPQAINFLALWFVKNNEVAFIITSIITILVCILIIKLGGGWKVYLKKLKEEVEKEETKKDKGMIKAYAGAVKEGVK